MTDETDVVTLADLRAAKVCWRLGAKPFLVRHGFDPKDALVNGIPARKLLATGDAIAIRIVEVSRGRKK